MYYYKFKVYYDEIDDFVRDVEILANDNFESFHKLLYDCIGLKGNEFAAFSICDQKWNKQKEITLMDVSEEMETQEPEYEENDSYSAKTHLPSFVMRNAILKDFISDPHQHIIYEYDFLNSKVFYLELQKVMQTDEDPLLFPRCTFKAMELPVQLATPQIADPEDFDLDLDDEDEDDDLFNDGYNDEDISELNEFSDFS